MYKRQIYAFTLRAVPRLVSDILEKNGLTMDDIDYVILHQANRLVLTSLRAVSYTHLDVYKRQGQNACLHL